MKILIVNFEYPPLGGGGGVATQMLAAELSKRHEVHVLTTLFGNLKYQQREGAVTIHRVRVIGRIDQYTASLQSLASFVPAAVGTGWRLGRKVRFDVINAQFVLPSGLVGAILARILGVPFVLSFIGGDLFDPSKGISPHRYAVLRWVVRRIAARAAVCTAISEDTKRRARELHGVEKNIVVTHLGIKAVSVAELSRASLGVPDGELLFISIGRLIPRKGYEILLSAWRDVPRANLIIVGGGPLRARLEDMAVELGIAKRVAVRGFVPEEIKHQLLQAADGYVSAADHEGFGLVFLEAMAAGLPIIATNMGGHTDFLRAEQNALLVPPGNAAALASAVRRLISDQELRESIGKRNRQQVASYYLANTARVFERVLMAAVHYDRRH